MNKHEFFMRLANRQLFLGDFADKEDVIGEFAVNADALDGAFILLAWYGHADYDGSAFVLYVKDDKLYEVNGGHCSCNGLEGQWKPEETTAAALIHRIKVGSLGCDTYSTDGLFADDLLEILERW